MRINTVCYENEQPDIIRQFQTASSVWASLLSSVN